VKVGGFKATSANGTKQAFHDPQNIWFQGSAHALSPELIPRRINGNHACLPQMPPFNNTFVRTWSGNAFEQKIGTDLTLQNNQRQVRSLGQVLLHPVTWIKAFISRICRNGARNKDATYNEHKVFHIRPEPYQ